MEMAMLTKKTEQTRYARAFFSLEAQFWYSVAIIKRYPVSHPLPLQGGMPVCLRSPATAMKKILILFAHPTYQRSHANKALLQALKSMDGVTIHDLYQRYPNMFIDVAHEQKLLLEHDIIVFQHPFYWYSCPALLKEWMDQVLEYGFAFGPEGNALRDKSLLSAITTGGSHESYTSQGHNHRAVTEYLIPFRQSAWLCGMRYLPPFVLYSYHAIQNVQLLRETARHYRRLLEALRDETLPADELQRATYLTDLTESLP